MRLELEQTGTMEDPQESTNLFKRQASLGKISNVNIELHPARPPGIQQLHEFELREVMEDESEFLGQIYDAPSTLNRGKFKLENRQV